MPALLRRHLHPPVVPVSHFATFFIVNYNYEIVETLSVTSVEPITVVTGTGSRIVLASMGTTQTIEASGASAVVTVTVTGSQQSTPVATPAPAPRLGAPGR